MRRGCDRRGGRRLAVVVHDRAGAGDTLDGRREEEKVVILHVVELLLERAVAVGVELAVGIGVIVAVGVAVAVMLAVLVGVRVGVTVDIAVGVAVGV